MTSAVFRRRRRSFVPVDQEGLDLLATVAEERDVVLEVIARRNPKHHRLFFAILRFIVEHTEFKSIEEAKEQIKLDTGSGKYRISKRNGKRYFVPRSLKVAKMDQTRFAAFFDRAVWVITNDYMPPGTTEESVRAELEAMIEPNDGRAAA